jgi:DNA-binding MarR family transcriptional regulator
MKSSSDQADHGFRFVTNHAYVLTYLRAHPEARLRDVAEAADVTERSAATIVSDLGSAGYVTKTRDGRRNRYVVHDDLPLRHPAHRHRTVGELIQFLENPAETAR